MFLRIIGLSVLSSFVLTTSSVVASEMDAKVAVEEVVEVAEVAAGVEEVAEVMAVINVGNKICPLTNEKVGTMGDAMPIEHEGKIYNLCCAMCAKDFKKDPARFIAIIEEELKTMDDTQADHVHVAVESEKAE
jgi:YHS domain-containing protein